MIWKECTPIKAIVQFKNFTRHTCSFILFCWENLLIPLTITHVLLSSRGPAVKDNSPLSDRKGRSCWLFSRAATGGITVCPSFGLLCGLRSKLISYLCSALNQAGTDQLACLDFYIYIYIYIWLSRFSCFSLFWGKKSLSVGICLCFLWC